jgi:hypothetical protein
MRKVKVIVGPLCGFSDTGTHTIWIDPVDHKNDRELLGTGGHEVAHLYFPEATETQISQFEEALCQVLYDKLKFRRPRKKVK